jgi:Holliday junction resolvase YEN1
MLVGGNYDEKGLPGCGSSTAMKTMKRGLGRSLYVCRNQRDCDGWALILDEALRSAGGRGLCVPPGFPDFKTLVKYNSPKVSSDETLRNNPKLNADYTDP